MINIHINWEGPYARDEALNMHSGKDYGLYQFYGDHLIYGSNVLLYLGKAESQTFGRRISQHNWEKWTSGQVTIYFGRIASLSVLESEEWARQICLSERIILQSHTPAFNSSNLNSIGHKIEDTRVLNWGRRKDLLPEISISRWEGDYAVGNKLHLSFTVQSRK